MRFRQSPRRDEAVMQREAVHGSTQTSFGLKASVEEFVTCAGEFSDSIQAAGLEQCQRRHYRKPKLQEMAHQ